MVIITYVLADCAAFILNFREPVEVRSPPRPAIQKSTLVPNASTGAWIKPEVERYQKEKLARVKKERDNSKVKETLAALKKAAQGKGNVVPPILGAVKVYATIGEISDTLREVFGEYRER